MSPQAKGLQIGGAIAVAMCAAFLVRWWMMPAESAWRLAADGSAWEASRDVNGAAILPERRYRLSGTGTDKADISWRMRPSDGEAPERDGSAGTVGAGAWDVAFIAGTDAPRRAVVIVRVAPASAVDAQSLRLTLAR